MAREERSAGFIAFYSPAPTPFERSGPPFDPASAEYLLLDHGRHWSFPKGHVKPGEDDSAAALRELREETGIATPEKVPHFCHEIHYYFRDRADRLVRKTVTYFLARVPAREITLSDEHAAARFLPFEQAIRLVTFASDRYVLRQAHAHLTSLL